MILATWNVNGIRARQAQVLEWLARARADVVCLQELKATPEQIQSAPWEAEGYWCHWHGAKAYSGVGLLVRRELATERPVFTHPAFDFEARIATTLVGGDNLDTRIDGEDHAFHRANKTVRPAEVGGQRDTTVSHRGHESQRGGE